MEGDCVAMQDARGALLVQNPACPPLVQNPTVSLGAEPPKDHIIWSILTFVYLCNPCCLGLAALIFSVKSRDQKALQDLEGARHYGATARCLNIIALSLVLSLIVIATICVVVKVNQAISVVHRYNDRFPSARYPW